MDRERVDCDRQVLRVNDDEILTPRIVSVRTEEKENEQIEIPAVHRMSGLTIRLHDGRLLLPVGGEESSCALISSTCMTPSTATTSATRAAVTHL